MSQRLHDIEEMLVEKIGKVAGMEYAAFRRQFAAYNPLAVLSGNRLLADQQYLLPGVVGADRCTLTTSASRRGRFRFQQIPAGVYILEVEAEGAQPYRATLTLDGDMDVEIVLDAHETAADASG